MRSGESPVKAQCLPFSQIPHTTPLFSDFLAEAPKTKPFYPRSTQFSTWFRDAARELKYDSVRRERVATILERQNRSWGASSQTLANLARFRSGACAFVTGQQVGLFGGPLFTILKALTAIKFADEACRGGLDCVPVFWLANEDHDLAEVNHVSIPSADSALRTLTTPTHGGGNAQVGSIAFGPEIGPVLEQAAQVLGESEITQLLRETYRPGETFGGAFARLFTKLFANWGLILLDGSDAELRKIAQPMFRDAIERAGELDDALLVRGRALEAVGYHQQVKVSASSTLLLAIQGGARLPIHRRLNGGSKIEFAIGEEKLDLSELLGRIDKTPENFSPNVLLRPVVQDYLLPTVAYAGGPAEVAYFAQCDVVYHTLAGNTTPVVSRFSATLITDKAQALLERYGLAFPDLFAGAKAVQERCAARTIPPDLQAAFDSASQDLDRSLEHIRAAIAELDQTLVAASATAASKMHHQINRLRGKAARAELARNELVSRHAQMLTNTLYPARNLQEREIAGVYFLARYGLGLLSYLHDSLRADCVDHQLIRTSF
jgi:bacillithiol biosynthesis cysteine-adding enzyme BshC